VTPERQGFLTTIARGMSGVDAALPDTYGVRHDDLAALLGEARDRYATDGLSASARADRELEAQAARVRKDRLPVVTALVSIACVERELEWPRFALLCLLAAVAAMGLAVLLQPGAVVVGVSGVIFAVAGWAVLRGTHRTRALGAAAWALLPVGVIYTFLVPGISIGGLLAGLALGYASSVGSRTCGNPPNARAAAPRRPARHQPVPGHHGASEPPVRARGRLSRVFPQT